VTAGRVAARAGDRWGGAAADEAKGRSSVGGRGGVERGRAAGDSVVVARGGRRQRRRHPEAGAKHDDVYLTALLQKS
jgi:hypothetical protein